MASIRRFSCSLDTSVSLRPAPVDRRSVSWSFGSAPISGRKESGRAPIDTYSSLSLPPSLAIKLVRNYLRRIHAGTRCPSRRLLSAGRGAERQYRPNKSRLIFDRTPALGFRPGLGDCTVSVTGKGRSSQSNVHGRHPMMRCPSWEPGERVREGRTPCYTLIKQGRRNRTPPSQCLALSEPRTGIARRGTRIGLHS